MKLKEKWIISESENGTYYFGDDSRYTSSGCWGRNIAEWFKYEKRTGSSENTTSNHYLYIITVYVEDFPHHFTSISSWKESVSSTTFP